MEDTTTFDSSIKNSLSFKGKIIDHSNLDDDDDDDEDDDQESGWTSYFEDLDFYNKNQQNPTSYPSSYCSSFCNNNINNNNNNPSLISDAASCIVASPPQSTMSMPRKLSFKKSRTKEISYLHDDSLEDTASSPVNSPKVFDRRSPRKIDDYMTNSQGKAEGSNQLDSKLQTKEGNEMKNYESIDLKKRGLCLVPLSMLVNYLG